MAKIKRFLVAVWSMSALLAVRFRVPVLKWPYLFFLRFDLAEFVFNLLGESGASRISRSRVAKNTGDRRAGERTEVGFLFGSACNLILTQRGLLRCCGLPVDLLMMVHPRGTSAASGLEITAELIVIDQIAIGRCGAVSASSFFGTCPAVRVYA